MYSITFLFTSAVSGGIKKKPTQRVKEVVNGVKMWFKMRGVINSAEVTPKSAKGEVKSLFKSFFSIIKKAEGGGESPSMEDRKEMEAEQKRISNGFRLFGKYYEALWD